MLAPSLALTIVKLFFEFAVVKARIDKTEVETMKILSLIVDRNVITGISLFAILRTIGHTVTLHVEKRRIKTHNYARGKVDIEFANTRKRRKNVNVMKSTKTMPFAGLNYLPCFQ